MQTPEINLNKELQLCGVVLRSKHPTHTGLANANPWDKFKQGVATGGSVLRSKHPTVPQQESHLLQKTRFFCLTLFYTCTNM